MLVKSALKSPVGANRPPEFADGWTVRGNGPERRIGFGTGLPGREQKAAAVQAHHSFDLSTRRANEKASLDSSLIPVRNEHLTQKRGVDKRYAFKV
jgi:hypothetical protein